ncbi:MAG: NAD-dependent epimerase/dehydratase family protein [Euryarchaeota archaeon]|nr:NAD-dependent epimerase/dehydratase family protein [Euryarchaeota archaeon]MDE1837297.1 NAD-dependent epimerase/dehydratase family protein [Euryarchaeota archaeon]MDE1879831.1 NAD-dependent epimerase/dehydratase family protein [Euryarchaeota archaeon]MDE2045272.1 NAD-dependent epimerase/dehydratase family protein [Thermoplasmata archaeon]
MKYFLTGGTGFIGGELASQLRRAGHTVHALVRDPARAQRLSQLGVDLFKGDVTDRPSLRAPMSGVDGVFHVAGWYKISSKDAGNAYPVNVEGTRNVLETMRELQVPKGVYTSTVAVFSDTHGRLVDESYRHNGPWLSVYDHTKWQAHYEVAEPMMKKGLPLVIVQPGAVYGQGDTSVLHDLVVQYLRGKLRAVPKEPAYCFATVEDTARGHLLAMERGRPGEAYILAGERKSVVEVLEMAERLTGVPAPKTHPPAWFVRFLAALSRSERLRVATATYIASNAKAVHELGFQPTPLSEGLPPYLRYEQEQLRQGPR